jgi:hypothetical protein
MSLDVAVGHRQAGGVGAVLVEKRRIVPFTRLFGIDRGEAVGPEGS